MHYQNWLCLKCKTYNNNVCGRCSLCSAPKPTVEITTDNKTNADEENITKIIYNSIEKMNYKSKVKLYRWMEDNIL